MEYQLPVSGRGELASEVFLFQDLCIIRIDNAKDPAFWAEIEIPFAILEHYLNEMRKIAV